MPTFAFDSGGCRLGVSGKLLLLHEGLNAGALSLGFTPEVFAEDQNLLLLLQVQNMAKAGAAGVLVYSLPDNPIQDMNCVGDECFQEIPIPASMVHLEVGVAQALR